MDVPERALEGPIGLRERKKQRTREVIVEAGLELFAERGYHATTVAEIAVAAELSERTVFTYFPTKEDILFSDHADFRDRLAVALAQRPAGRSALDTLRDFVVDNLERDGRVVARPLGDRQPRRAPAEPPARAAGGARRRHRGSRRRMSSAKTQTTSGSSS